MKASEAPFLSVLRGPRQFCIPIYQRTYSWNLKQCSQLWDDIVRVARDPHRSGHFVGSIVYVERGLYTFAELPQFLVIDGQQRLTTLTLLLTALRKALPDEDGAEMTARKLTNYYLVNSDEEGDRRPKLLLTQGDRDTLIRLVEGTPLPQDPSRRIQENFRFFEEEIAKGSVSAETIYQGVAKLIVVSIALDREHDNPQLIFESLNSTGLALSQADLIRNYILMGLEPGMQDKLYTHYWRAMERRFEASNDSTLFDRFMRDYLTVRTGSIPNIRDVYESFKAFAAKEDGIGVEALVAEIAEWAGYFANIALGEEPDSELRRRFADINALRVDVAYPLLLELYHDYATGALAHSAFADMLSLIESYVFRRAIVGIPTNSLNKTFSEFTDRLDKSRYLDSFKARLLLLDSYRRFPRDEEFMREFVVKDVYTLTTRRHYLLRKLENDGRKEPVNVEQYTIEHILPQNEDLSPEWRAMLGADWQATRDKYLHTTGNLTLTGYNSELSDRPFHEKREMTGGFEDSPLRLNRDLACLNKWTDAEIQARSQRLAEQAIRVWPAPSLDPNALQSFKPAEQSNGATTYTLGDHHYLVGGTRELFDAFRSRVLALGPNVTMHVLKIYIAFKANTNFVDVVPQATRLRLSLNMPFTDLDDPMSIAEDVTGIGRWGNGDVQVLLSSLDELDYAMNLVKQSYDRQVVARC